MYEGFYGFSEKPFSLLPDPTFLFLSPKHQKALTMLQFGMMNQAGFTVITGEIGSGKTTLIRQLLSEIGEDVTVGLVSNTHRSFGELLQWVLLAFGLEYRDKKKVELYQTLADFIVKEYSKDRRTVLIIDEAQNLDVDALEELRMLSNINSDKDQFLQLILVGQPHLRETLRRPEMHQFAQRIAVDYSLTTLTLEETWQYIRHRLKVAGGDPNLFDTKACAAVYYYTSGTPRLINSLCEQSLVVGFAEQKKRIDVDIVCDVVRERQKGGIFPVHDPQKRLEGGVVKELTAVRKETREV
ncbi:MAG: general secretion pathway protein [Candidatus Muproteobacteria bacterium RBG_16_60_9]|uniref:General secretion pathway protein n=1 Tax=Candidatus Muproteobacteria bacterium RBG_16_60_9 TaxID=1817755 RepID=A0A1F6UWI0_9PROT|nr:MAG: general secretion pathway protein [Candidatus Muproteobacteria bacterium RBG_16_60_9]